MEKMDFVKKKTKIIAIFVALLTSFILNDLSARHLIKVLSLATVVNCLNDEVYISCTK